MANSRVDYFGVTLMDITDTTADPASVTRGKVFYTAAGERAVGTAEYQEKITHGTAALASAAWAGSDPYTQTLLSGEDADVMIELLPSYAQLSALAAAGVRSLTVVNNGGTVTVTASGAKPTEALAMRYKRTRVYSSGDVPVGAEYEPKITLLTLSVGTAWTQSGTEYRQTVLTGQDAGAMIDVQLTGAQASAMQEANVTALWCENNGGTVTLVCAGGHPTQSMSVQATRTIIYEEAIE